MEVVNTHKYEVEKDINYEYITTYKNGDILPSGKPVGEQLYIKVRHIYCNNIYTVKSSSFINMGSRCTKCCHIYENSFAYHIEVELGLNINDVWNFEKNTVNPYHISKHHNGRVLIKCQEKDYHGSYQISANSFTQGHRCSYCYGRKVHPKDSFAQYHIDNTDKDFLEKYWDYDKNIMSPWEISPGSSTKKVWIKCQNEEVNEINGLMKKDYHGSYEVQPHSFTSGVRCGRCVNRPKNVHPYDSFGYYNFDKVMSWHPNNEMSPFRVSRGSSAKLKFICFECGNVWNSRISHIDSGSWCPSCSASKGENRIKTWLDCNNVDYIHDEPYFCSLVGTGGKLLRPDFILPKQKIWIEYDGEFHYKKMYDNDCHEVIKLHDKRKDEYAKLNNWKLIRIPYWEFNNIDKILKMELSHLIFMQ